MRWVFLALFIAGCSPTLTHTVNGKVVSQRQLFASEPLAPTMTGRAHESLAGKCGLSAGMALDVYELPRDYESDYKSHILRKRFEDVHGAWIGSIPNVISFDGDAFAVNELKDYKGENYNIGRHWAGYYIATEKGAHTFGLNIAVRKNIGETNTFYTYLKVNGRMIASGGFIPYQRDGNATVWGWNMPDIQKSLGIETVNLTEKGAYLVEVWLASQQMHSDTIKMTVVAKAPSEQFARAVQPYRLGFGKLGTCQM